jgi:hypothetical protein
MKKTRKRDFLILGALGCILIALAIVLPKNPGAEIAMTSEKSPEIERILSLTDTQARSDELESLLERVGPVEAQEQMLRSGLPFTGETHLLIHTVGNFIYEKYGKEGLSNCKDYFLSACYHAVILNTLGDKGIDGVAEAMVLCDKAGGTIVSSQCAHGAGHGFVAWHDYDLLKGVKMCDELGAKVERFSYFNCYDGAFMENIWGVHEGAPSPKRWVRADDIYYPCDEERIPEKYKNGCWSNQATLIYQHYKGDLRKTAIACDGVENLQYRETCYNNFSRQIHPLTNGSIEKVKSLCGSATGKEWRDYCILANMTAYWSVGDRSIPFSLCGSLEGNLGESCFARLANMIPAYYPDAKDRSFYCNKIDSTILRKQCLSINI